MKPLYYVALLVLCITSCKKAHENETPDVSDIVEEAPVVFGKQFFDYDAIEHYSIDYPDNKVIDFYDEDGKMREDDLRGMVIAGSMFTNMKDIKVIKKLTSVGFKKEDVSESKFNVIDSIFVEKTREENGTVYGCLAVYRDVLVFKKNKSIIGVAKICFGCGDHWIIGTDANTENFGQNGDYYKLKKLLNR